MGAFDLAGAAVLHGKNTGYETGYVNIIKTLFTHKITQEVKWVEHIKICQEISTVDGGVFLEGRKKQYL